MATDYPQPVQFNSNITLQDSQNADTSSQAIETRQKCLDSIGKQTLRESRMNSRARDAFNFPICPVLERIRDDALRRAEE